MYKAASVEIYMTSYHQDFWENDSKEFEVSELEQTGDFNGNTYTFQLVEGNLLSIKGEDEIILPENYEINDGDNYIFHYFKNGNRKLKMKKCGKFINLILNIIFIDKVLVYKRNLLSSANKINFKDLKLSYEKGKILIEDSHSNMNFYFKPKESKAITIILTNKSLELGCQLKKFEVDGIYKISKAFELTDIYGQNNIEVVTSTLSDKP